MTNRGMEKLFLTIALIAVVALGAVEIVRATGYLQERNLFLTLNIALPLFVLAMTYQVYLRRKRSNPAR
jgi:hypothetical protein